MLKIRKERSFLVKRNHVVRAEEVLADLGIKKYDENLLWVGRTDAEESTWRFDVRLNDEELERLLRDLSEYKVIVLGCFWLK